MIHYYTTHSRGGGRKIEKVNVYQKHPPTNEPQATSYVERKNPTLAIHERMSISTRRRRFREQMMKPNGPQQ